MTNTKSKRKPGLTALAGVNFLNFLAATIFVILRSTDTLKEPPSTFETVTGALSGILALASGIGFLNRSWRFGYQLGNIYAIFLFTYAVGFLVARESLNPMEYFAWLSYPLVLLIALNIVFRDQFERPLETL